MKYSILSERPSDWAGIEDVIHAAFQDVAHSDGSEAAIVDGLRAAGALVVSLVAVSDDQILGHVAFSPVSIEGGQGGWYGLGPVSVSPPHQGQGIGGALIREGLQQLQESGAAGCVVLGDPGYYQRFGFKHDPAIRYEGAPAEYFMCLQLDDSAAEISGNLTYHEAFSPCWSKPAP